MRLLIITFLVLFFTAAPLEVRSLLAARGELRHARQLRNEGNAAVAAERYAAAAAWRSPFNRYAAQAFTELQQLAAETSDPAEKLEMLHSVQTAHYSSRSFLSALASNIDPTAIGAEIERLWPQGQGKITLREVHPPRVDFKFQVLSQLFFWLWVFSVMLLIFKAFDREGRVIAARAVRYASPALLCYAGWLWCLRWA